MRSTDYVRSGVNTSVDVHMTIEQKDDTNYFGFGLGDTVLATSNQTKTVYTSESNQLYYSRFAHVIKLILDPI